MSRLKIGIVGCGEVTQIIHIPALQHLSDQFQIVALCDVSAAVLEGLAGKIANVRTFTDHQSMLAEADIDAVLIANPHVFHADTAISAMEHGKHVFIEKPMCMTMAEADRLAEAEARTGRTVQIGYMRRYAGAFLEAIEMVRERHGRVKFARVHDFIGANASIVADTSNVVRDPNLSEEGKEALRSLGLAKVQEAIGAGPGSLANSYMLLLGLSSHDISAMRDILGRPRQVLHASSRQAGRCMTALFDYGDFVCEFATGVDTLPRYDTFIEVYCEDAVIRVEYDTPYVRNLPARLKVTTANGGGIERVESYPSRLDTFVIEWKAFHDSIANNTRPRTGIADARQDLEIFGEIVEHLRLQDTRVERAA